MTSDVDLVRKKLVVVGNGNVGKTSLLYAFKDNRFCQDYVPTLFEGNTHIIDVDNKRIELLLIDTAGQEEFFFYFGCCSFVNNNKKNSNERKNSTNLGYLVDYH